MSDARIVITTPTTGVPILLEAPARARDRFPHDELARLVALRRELHRHPELSWKEYATSDRLAAVAESLGGTVQRVANTGVVARFRGRDPAAPVVAVRGDIDALPIQEETGLDYASAVPGVMHACGHDVHATWAIGAAMDLVRHPARGDVLVVLQPAEEVGAGAPAILDSGILDHVAAIFGGHVDRRFDVGQVIAEPGPLAASADTFAITLVGRGAHGARPHESADAVVAAAAVITALQTIVARRLDPAAPAVCTVGSVHAGVAANVIPEKATLTGTLRAMDPVTRRRLGEEVTRLATQVGEAYGVRAEVTLELGTPPIVNPVREAGWARQAATQVLGEDAVVPFGITNMGGEDFAFYMERIPGCFLRIGAREPGGASIAAHSPRFYAADGAIMVGAAVLAECARVASEALADGR
ncbi:MAG TPA: M20 family metallopeptidase [Gemmatimonadaceae bacterium]|nr:M20 family metallopeptidase [Gemmatimonadaceae bacterium]